MSNRSGSPQRAAPARLALPLAILLALASTAHAAPDAPAGSSADKYRTIRVDVGEIVERAQQQAREAIERAAAATRDAQRDALQADLDFDLEWPMIAFIGSEFGVTREIVKNAPYTADAVSESIQVLQDGNRIVKRSTTKLARDTYGRTRQEKESPHGGTVYIFDPIDNRNYALNPQKRSAVRIPRVPAVPVPPMAGVELTGPLIIPAPPTPPTPIAPVAPVTGVTPPPSPAPAVAPPPPVPPGVAARGRETERVIVRRGEGTPPADDVRIEVIRIGGRDGDGTPRVAALPPIAMPLLPQGDGERKSLGTRDFDGVKADGTQTTHTIPAGEIGNEKAIVITSERWFSPELQLVVFARTRDPRAGETIYRLANLRRGEPPADLFRVPADYRRRDSRG